MFFSAVNIYIYIYLSTSEKVRAKKCGVDFLGSTCTHEPNKGGHF